MIRCPSSSDSIDRRFPFHLINSATATASAPCSIRKPLLSVGLEDQRALSVAIAVYLISSDKSVVYQISERMMSHTSTPFKVLENPGDENDSSVMRSTFKGQRATDFPMKGLSSFSSVSKAGGLSGITKSTRKPLLDLSKGQLNSRLSTTTTKTHSHHHGVVINPMAMGHVPIKSKSRSVTTQHPFKKPNTEHNIVRRQI